MPATEGVPPDIHVSIVIPAYDEARRLPSTLAGWIGFFARQPYRAEIVVVDDGSRDGTADVVRAVAAQQPMVRLLRLDTNRGKGGAVRAGMLIATGVYLFYADADLNVAPEHVTPAVRLLDGGYDVVIGQRRLRDYAAAERSLPRLLAGALVQVVRRALVLPVIRDTQCGFKGFRRQVARAIFERTLIRSFAFDIEVLFLARKLGAAMVELPVTTTYRAGSSYSLRRHLAPFLRDIVQIRVNALRGRYAIPGRERSGNR
ncbi:MAG: glycosyltransferase [Chloroflexota bacterium]